MLVVVVVLVVAGTVHSFLDRDKCSDVVVVPRTFNFVPRFSFLFYVTHSYLPYNIVVIAPIVGVACTLTPRQKLLILANVKHVAATCM